MKQPPHEPAPATPHRVRCAVYTRKSSAEGLDQDFNSLDAQREAAEAFITSQAGEGWACLPEHYDDGGCTGANLDRPALRRLLDDIEAAKVECVVVYKVDRLSRSLLDFARMMETFEHHRVAFVSVTQQFNTATSMGRLVLNILLSFAQFERELIAERTRDKVAATRRKGKWSGGRPPLGYDVDPRGPRLVINEAEALRVRAIFDLYLEQQALLPVVRELERRGWVNKRWTTRAGPERGGQRFTKTSLYRLLTNVAYAGQVRYQDEVHTGEQPALVDPGVFAQVQATLRRHGRPGGGPARDRPGALLRGLLRCQPCGCAMTPSHTSKHGKKQYHYYVCSGAQKRGWHTCPSKSVPAGEIERVVLEQLRGAGQDPAWFQEVFAAAGELGKTPAGNVREPPPSAHRPCADRDPGAQAPAAFDAAWDALTPTELAQLVRRLVARVDYDGAAGTVLITGHHADVRTPAEGGASRAEETA